MTIHSFLSAQMDAVETLLLPGGDAVVFSCASPLRPGANEDAAAVMSRDDGRCLLVVADGLGGHINGAAASAHVTRALEDVLDSEDAKTTIQEKLETANHELLLRYTGEGSTLAAVAIRGDKLFSCHVGDSEIIVSGQRGKIKMQSLSHSPVAEAMADGYLNEQEALTHSERHLISNYVGMPGMSVSMSRDLALAPRDTVLLGSDGLFDNLYQEEIVNIMRKGKLTDAAKRLARLASARMRGEDPCKPSKPDDLTFILYRRRNA